MKSSPALTIGQVAARYGVAPHVLRHWEDAGLLSPSRENGQRRYSEVDVLQVRLTRIGRELGLGLGEIRELFTVHDTGDRAEALVRQRAVVEKRIAQARRRLELIEGALLCPHPDYRTCPELAAMLEDWDDEGEYVRSTP
ncbi:MerR family transcriptional regulator [Cryptosporangium aurantiacum]|uniref:DNA-binding transcriptional regulator, MerR family n=1 Tax=Cryptosporangium aurantiacum TaxID=134849 RepID=A0A1M7RPT2_9ACTN|nr:MerR family transcriptional regulator [Cryptosporangium aurantiacum]SHN48239.1 DNA-binding transcriptional regulator, MerR family [Cryptosporangium aurantiacum]